MKNDLSSIECKMFAEIEKILNEYKGTTREFGMCLIHEHFELKSSEVLYETNDKIGRSLRTIPIETSGLPKSSFVSAWNFINHIPSPFLYCCDGSDGGYGHNETGGNR